MMRKGSHTSPHQKYQKRLERADKQGMIHNGFVAGIPTSYVTDNYFVYLESLRDSRFWASRALFAEVSKMMRGELSQISIDGTYKDGEYSMGPAFARTFRFLDASLKVERSKEITTIHALRDIIEKRFGNLEANNANLNAEKVKRAKDRMQSYLQQLDMALSSGTTPNIDAKTLIGLFDALRQNLNVFVSGVSNSIGQYDEDTKERAKASLAKQRAEGRPDTTHVINNTVDAHGKNSAAHANNFRTSAMFGDVLQKLTNRLAGSDSTTFSLADLYAQKILEFFKSKGGKDLTEKFVQAGGTSNTKTININAFLGLCYMLVDEWNKEIAAEIDKTTSKGKHEIRKQDIEKIMRDEHFIDNFLADSNSDLVQLGKNGTQEQLKSAYQILENIGSKMGLQELSAEAADKRRKAMAKEQEEREKGINKGRRRTYHRFSETVADALKKNPLTSVVGELIGGMNSSQMGSIQQSFGWATDTTQQQVDGTIYELVVQLAAMAIPNAQIVDDSGRPIRISAHSQNIGGYGGGTDNVTRYIGSIKLAPEFIHKLDTIQEEAEKELAKRRQETLRDVLEKQGVTFDQAANQGSATRQSLKQDMQELTQMQEKMKAQLEAEFKEGGELSVTHYFSFQESEKNYYTMEITGDEMLKQGGTGGKRTAKYEGRSFKLANFVKELGAIAMSAGLPNMNEDIDKVISIILNSQAGTVLNAESESNNRYILYDYLSMYANLMMFDDDLLTAQNVGQQIQSNFANINNEANMNTSGITYSRIHLYVLNGHYVPLSYVLQRLKDNLTALCEAYNSHQSGDVQRARNERSATTTVSISGMDMTDIQDIVDDEDIQPYRKRWSYVSEDMLNSVTVKILFLKDFGNTINEMFGQDYGY